MLNLPHSSFAGNAAGQYCLKLKKLTEPVVDQEQQVETQESDTSDSKEFLHCTTCQFPITRKVDRIDVNEKHEHVFVNPHGFVYQIGCFAQAPGCVVIGQATSHFSWFPGYTWQLALCVRCQTLLGWAFRSPGSQFFGLIVDKLVEAPSSQR